MSDEATFQGYIASERERLSGYRSRYVEMRADAEREIANIDREFVAIEAYEAAKTGKAQHPRATAPRRPRDGSRRESIINLLDHSPSGMTRSEILTALGVKGDRSGESAVSNALSMLVKSGRLVREGGVYRVPAEPLHAAAE